MQRTLFLSGPADENAMMVNLRQRCFPGKLCFQGRNSLRQTAGYGDLADAGSTKEHEA